ncbi:hypothetical protein ACEPAH_7444 [Sanghuangporus vaninii]
MGPSVTNLSFSHPFHPTKQLKSDSMIFRNSRVYFLAFVAFWGIITFGYDTGITGGIIAQDSFINHFLVNEEGIVDSSKVANISGNVVSVLQAGAFFGSLGSAPISSQLGRRLSLICSSIIFALGAILQTISGTGGRGLGYIYSGRFVAGVGIGGISSISPTFVAECSPKNVRGRITGIFEIMAVTGVMISYFVNFGISQHGISGPLVWQIPFGIQLIPTGIMVVGLLFVKESPRWLAYCGKTQEALESLAYLRKENITSQSVQEEMAEIEAAIDEEREVLNEKGAKEIFFGKGNLSRFVFAFFLQFFQQWTGQNSVNYFAPQMFEAIGYHGATQSLFASGIYGIIKVVTVIIFTFFLVELFGRKTYLAISSVGSGVLFFTIGAILKTHPPDATASGPSAASKAMAALLYIFVVFYSIGWGPVPWIMSPEIFSTHTRHYGLAVSSGSQWLWNFTVTRISPLLIASLGWKIFMVYAAIDLGPMLFFCTMLIPETRGKSLEEMDVVFGRVSQEQRDAKVKSTQRILEADLQEPHMLLQSDVKDEV